MPLLSCTRGSTPVASPLTAEEIPVVPIQGNVVHLRDECMDDSDSVRDALVLSPVSPPNTYPFKNYQQSELDNIATVDFVREVWLVQQEDIDRFQNVDEEQGVCAICLSPVQAKAAVVTKCQHVFHLDCCRKSENIFYYSLPIAKTACWTCPCCREVVSSDLRSPQPTRS